MGQSLQVLLILALLALSEARWGHYRSPGGYRNANRFLGPWGRTKSSSFPGRSPGSSGHLGRPEGVEGPFPVTQPVRDADVRTALNAPVLPSEGSCPPVRISCTVYRTRQQDCSSDTDCGGTRKCCFDICVQKDVCKSAVPKSGAP